MTILFLGNESTKKSEYLVNDNEMKLVFRQPDMSMYLYKTKNDEHMNIYDITGTIPTSIHIDKLFLLPNHIKKVIIFCRLGINNSYKELDSWFYLANKFTKAKILIVGIVQNDKIILDNLNKIKKWCIEKKTDIVENIKLSHLKELLKTI